MDDEEAEPANINECLLKLSNEAKDLYLGSSVPELDCVPDPLTFYRAWVSSNRPVIFRGAGKSWPAFRRWRENGYLLQKCGKDLPVTVAVTPDGYADAATDGETFVMPYEETMKLSDFVGILEDPCSTDGVHYMQRQNSNLTVEMAPLVDDIIEPHWATAAFGKSPDAVNFWMGDGRAITSTHKDPYENIYCVVRGHKDFILFPPTDQAWLRVNLCQPANYERSPDGRFRTRIRDSSPAVPWITVDPLSPDPEKYPEYKHANPIKCRVDAGDILYLPSLWYHHVRQSHGCIAVNFWYDMEYDLRYNYFNFVSDVHKLCRRRK